MQKGEDSQPLQARSNDQRRPTDLSSLAERIESTACMHRARMAAKAVAYRSPLPPKEERSNYWSTQQ
jgi:hypothetical protein